MWPPVFGKSLSRPLASRISVAGISPSLLLLRTMITRRATQPFPAATTTLFFRRLRGPGSRRLPDPRPRSFAARSLAPSDAAGLPVAREPCREGRPRASVARGVSTSSISVSAGWTLWIGFVRLSLPERGSHLGGSRTAPTWFDRSEMCRDARLDGGCPNYSTTAMQSTSTCMPSRFVPTVVRAGGSFSKNSLYTSLNSANRVRSVT